MGSGSILLALWEREELDAHDWDSDPFVKNLPSQDPRPAPGGGEKLWLTPWGCRGPGQAGSAHLPAEGRAGLSSERLALNLAGPLRPAPHPGSGRPPVPRTSYEQMHRPSEGPWDCPTPGTPAPLLPPPVEEM